MAEIESSIGVVDKRLAEFVLKVARASKTIDDFESKLKSVGAAFDSDLLKKMYAMITKLLPESFQR